MKHFSFKSMRKLFGNAPTIVRGTPPGVLKAAAHFHPTTVHLTAYTSGNVEEIKLDSVEDLAGWLDREETLWVRVVGLGDVETISRIGEMFQLHALALEDVLNFGQRPKVEEYHDHLFVVLPMLVMEDHPRLEQLSLFLGHRYLITFQDSMEGFHDPIRERLRRGKGRIRSTGTDYLAYTIFDNVIDAYFPILEKYGERLENIEIEILDAPHADLITQIHGVKRDLVLLRRSLWPLREAARHLREDDSGLIAEDTAPFLRDCHDHVIQALDLLETYRESGTALSDFYLSGLSHRMNEVMKVLTIIATIFIPITFIAGIYGMNFDPEKSPLNLPELSWYYGYPYAMILMGIIAFLMVLYFKRKKWL